MSYLLIFTPPSYAIGVTMLVYSFYFILTTVQFVLFLILLSERPREDARLAPTILVMPLFMIAIRMWSVVAAVHEWFNRAHQDTSMGPHWVIKRGGPR